MSAENLTAARADLTRAEAATAAARRTALQQLATRLNGQVTGSSDQAKMNMLVAAVNELAGQ